MKPPPWPLPLTSLKMASIDSGYRLILWSISNDFTWCWTLGVRVHSTLTGSMCRVLRTMAKLAKPQNAGSSWVPNCSMRRKNPSRVPSSNASLNFCWPMQKALYKSRPQAVNRVLSKNLYWPEMLEKAIAGGEGSSRLYNEADCFCSG